MSADPIRAVVDAVGAAVGEHGFAPDGHDGGFWWFRREDRGAVLYVAVQAHPPAAAARLLARVVTSLAPPTATVSVGVVHPVVSIAFARPVPVRPRLPAEGHVAERLGLLLPGGVDRWYEPGEAAQAAHDVVATGLPWLERYADPRRALADDVVQDPFVALEMAAVVDDREAGMTAADRAQQVVVGAAGTARTRLDQRRRLGLDHLLGR